jgi:fibronectin-binding autotransporter adhesin
VPTGTTGFFGTSSRTTITGGNTVSGLTFNAGASAYSFTGSFTFAGAGIVNNSSTVQTFTNGSLTFFENSSTAGTNTTITNNGSITFSETASGGSATIVNNGGGSLISFADSTTAGNATVTTRSGAKTQFTGNGTAGNAQLIANAGGIVEFSGTSGPLGDNKMSAGSIAGAGTYNLGTNQLTVGGNNLSTAVSGTINDGGDFGGTGASLVKVGTGTLTLSGANTFTGGLSINGGTVAVSANNNLGGASGGVTFGGGTLQTTASFTTTRTATLNATGTFNTASATTLTWNGAIGGSGGLDKIGSGTMVLGGANSYTGGTMVDAGVLRLGATGSLAAGSALAVNGGTFDLNGHSQTVGALSGTGGTITLGIGALTAGDSSNTTLASAISGTGSFTKQGSGTLTLGGANAYTGGTTINGGAVAVSSDGNLGGASGGLVFGGGTLQYGAGFSSARTVTLNSGGGTFNTNGFSSTLSGNIGGAGGLTKAGAGTLILSGANGYSGGTTVSGGILQGNTTSLQGNILNNASVVFDQVPTGTYAGAMSGSGSLTKQNSGTLILTGANSYSGGTTVSAGVLQGNTTSLQGDILNTASVVLNQAGNGTYAGAMSCGGSFTLQGGGAVTVTGANSYSGGTTVSASTLVGTTASLQGNVLNNGAVVFNQAGAGSYGGAMSGGGSLTLLGGGAVTLSGANSYSGGTTISGGTLAVSSDGNLGAAGGGLTFGPGTLQYNAGFSSARTVTLNAGGGTFNTNGFAATLSGNIGGAGGLTKTGAGTLILAGINSYSGGTTVAGGILQGTTSSLQGNILNNAAMVFNQAGSGTYAGNMSGSGSLTLQGGGGVLLTGINSYTGGTTLSGGILAGNTSSLQGNITDNGAVVFNQTAAGIYGGVMSGSGSLTLNGSGLLNLTGNNTYTGPTTVNGGTLAVNGSITSNVTVNSGGTLGGNGTIAGSVVNAGILAPGNSIGTLNVVGSYTQFGGTYQVEVNTAGQGDRINVSGAPGTAVIQGGTVQVLAAAGSYANSTIYTIVNATGGVSGAYSGVTSNFAFLTSTLSYDANDVFLTLALGQNAFTSFSGITPNQKAVGTALNQSFANASGDFATVIGALAGLNTAQGPVALDTISGQPYADFGTMNTNSSAMFMNALGQQMANARGVASAGQRQALAQACEVEACDGASPLSAWANALGGLGSVLGDSNASTLTYNFGGAAAGIDYRLDPRFLVGIGVGYTHGTQWVNSFMGQGWSDSVSVAAYGSFTQAGFYADALAGYAYFNNQLQRQILIPGLQQRTATGSTGANQFLGQAEGGYKVGIYAPAMASITPFGRLQISSVTQNAFSESGAQSLSLNVAQQTTNSLRTTIGADLASSIGLGNERKLDLAVRLGWQHEFADTGRPITAAFAGAPGNSFTVCGATPARDAAVVGFQATTTIAAATQVYLRYDGGVGGGTDNHPINVGLRMSW